MPAALERKLKRQVAGKNISEERKDAYVYGTLRKTGWKPSREKKKTKNMSTPNERMVRLAAIDKKLDSIIQFQYDDEPRPATYSGLAKIGAGVGVGAGGLLLHGAIRKQGGYQAAWKAGQSAFKDAGNKTGQMLLPGMEAVKGVGSKVGGFLGKITKPLLGRFGLESNEKPIRFNTLMGPWQGSMKPESKIDEQQFPAGISPAAALKMPFPQLMALLNKRNLQQQVYSSKLERLIELNEKLDSLRL
jgi:hypothetical protein